jgi:methionyl-tRNA formyltransferase|tara:strand:- start:114 stop:902 length:789 start_codon:yes stop_codon:yes gene_type:complete
MPKSIKVAIVATDNHLYKNSYINQLVRDCSTNIQLIVELNFKHPKTNTKSHYSRYFQLLGIKGLIFLTFTKIKQILLMGISSILSPNDGFNLKQIAKKNNVNYGKCTSVNSDLFINLLKNNDIDYILNSGNQIYKKKILEAYKNKILNRHSALLPSYGGIYPIFWQLLNKETKGGVTLHWIDETIDKGNIAYQKGFPIQPSKSLFYHYKIAFAISLELSRKAITDLSMGKIVSYEMEGKESYYSWPKKNDIKKFRREKFKIA